ncbi:hypothetical protein SB778_17110 [Paraburkholderia sp. SIMBA_050]|uniref:hypothetical protein n=1 Tax=Paraburkholderia TaxID=1822464 RepID=UPI003218703A
MPVPGALPVSAGAVSVSRLAAAFIVSDLSYFIGRNTIERFIFEWNVRADPFVDQRAQQLIGVFRSSRSGTVAAASPEYIPSNGIFSNFLSPNGI